MRTIPADELALWRSDAAVREYRVRVRRPEEGAWTDLSGTMGGDWVLSVRVEGETPDQPATRFTLTFLKHEALASLSPGIGASDLNTDAAGAYRPIIHPGRSVEVDVRVGDGVAWHPWRLWLQGIIDTAEWPGAEVVAQCLTLDGILQDTQIEVEEPRGAEDPGTPLADEIQGLLDRWMGSNAPTVLVLGSPELGIGPYRPAVGSLGGQIRELAQRIGWDVRYLWSEADQDFRLTLYLPPRDKKTPDMALAADEMHAVSGLSQSRRYVRNAFPITHTDADGKLATLTVLDQDSIDEYGRLAMPITEPELDAAQAAALGAYAKSDLSRPLVDGRYQITFLPWVQLHDLLQLTADGDRFDYDATFAVVSVAHEVSPDGGAWSTVDLRGGAPVGQFYAWHKRSLPTIPSTPVSAFALDLKEIGRTQDDATFDGPWGARIAEVRTFEVLVPQPYNEDRWPGITGDATQGPFLARVPLVFPLPPQGYARLVRVVGLLADGTPGAIERLTILPTGTEPDLVTSRSVLVDDATGAAEIRVDVADRTRSIRYAYAVGSAPAWPSDAAVEAGTVVALTGSASITLPAGTVGYMETIRVRVAAYTGARGAGHDGPGDHGPIVGAEDLRLPPDVSLEPTATDETDALGTYGVTVHDVAGQATGLYKYYRSGASAWVGPILVTATPEDGVEYLATVALEEDHRSAIKFRLEYTKNGSPGYVESASPPFDRGKIPDITILPTIDEAARTASAAVSGDYDTASVRIAASASGYPSAATVRAATAINGRDLTAATVGTLLSGLTAGQTVYYAAFGYSAAGGGGNESSSLAVAKAVVGVVAPLLEVASETEVGAVGTFGVTVRDPSGVATGLYYRTKSGDADWSAWTLQTGTPAHGATYARTVTLVEDHLSFIEWRLDYTLLGAAKSYSLKSSGLDLGRVPDLSIVPVISETGAVSCEVQGDFDTASVRIAASIAGYPSDATVRAAAAINGRNIPASMVGTLLTLKVGETAYLKAFGYSEAGGAGTESSAAITATITRGASYTPKVQAEVTRSGTTATVTLVAEDLLKRVTALEWSSQAQGGTATAFSGAWTSSTGTPGTDATLTRVQTFTVPNGADLAVRWRVTFVDENGATKVVSGALAVPNLSAVNKVLRISHHAFSPASDTVQYFHAVNNVTLNGATPSNGDFFAALPMPPGVTITSISLRGALGNGANQCKLRLYRLNADDGNTSLAEAVTPFTTDTTTTVSSIGEVVSGTVGYLLNVFLAWSAGTAPTFRWVEVQYTAPTYDKTY